jgi:hypothetical protein
MLGDSSPRSLVGISGFPVWAWISVKWNNPRGGFGVKYRYG